jgi:hypothetical protein
MLQGSAGQVIFDNEQDRKLRYCRPDPKACYLKDFIPMKTWAGIKKFWMKELA